MCLFIELLKLIFKGPPPLCSVQFTCRYITQVCFVGSSFFVTTEIHAHMRTKHACTSRKSEHLPQFGGRFILLIFIIGLLVVLFYFSYLIIESCMRIEWYGQRTASFHSRYIYIYTNVKCNPKVHCNLAETVCTQHASIDIKCLPS